MHGTFAGSREGMLWQLEKEEVFRPGDDGPRAGKEAEWFCVSTRFRCRRIADMPRGCTGCLPAAGKFTIACRC